MVMQHHHRYQLLLLLLLPHFCTPSPSSSSFECRHISVIMYEVFLHVYDVTNIVFVKINNVIVNLNNGAINTASRWYAHSFTPQKLKVENNSIYVYELYVHDYVFFHDIC
ncbi:hypothetical protein O6H91_Y102700 [Diphasiastrum complanatum]|nr:hypothetical protein O6H91_Y102700 [Diphasiastrum complanatum]